MRKIALRGMAGRRRDTLLLGGVVTLAMIPVSGGDYFGGDNSYCLGVYTPDLVELGRFQLKEGHWPQARDEVVLEYARLASLGAEMGDSFTVLCQLRLPMTEAFAAEKNTAYEQAVEEARTAAREACLELSRFGDWEMTERGLWISGQHVLGNGV